MNQIDKSTKQCSKCGEIKDLSEFVFRKDTGKYRNECKSCTNIRSRIPNRIRRDANKEQINQRLREWRATPEYKEYLLKSKENRQQKAKEYHQEHGDEIRERANQWRIDNPEKRAESQRKRRAKKHSVNENFTKEDVLYTKELFNHKCANCGSNERLCIDHHMPLDLGYPLTRQNAVLLCVSCNSSKKKTLPEDFYSPEKLQWIEERLSPPC